MQHTTKLQIRKAVPEDTEILTAISRKTFFETFAPTNDLANLQACIDAHFTIERQRAELLAPDSQIFLAMDGANPAAYLHLKENSTAVCVRNKPTMELKRLYVDQPWHGKGVAHQLMELAKKIAREKACRSIWLGVWEENHRALRFYQKHGFQKVGTHVFMMGPEAQTDDIMEAGLI